MNDLQIDYFMAVATNLSFTKTSEELFVSQPAISRQISQLEKELGCKLFRRNNQGTELTEEGRLYFDLFSKYKAEFINTKMKAERITGRNKAVMRVGFLEGWDLFNIIPPMMDKYTLDIVVTMQNSVKLYSEFECKDVAIIGKILIYSALHPLAQKDPKELSLRDFSDDLFIAPWEIVDKMIIDAIANYTRPYGFIPKLRFVKNHESTITCVRNNMGVTIADDWVWAKGADDLRWIPFKAQDTIAVARLKSKNNRPPGCDSHPSEISGQNAERGER